MKDPKYYSCAYCHNDFEPKRRRVQKYCSNTCRSKAHHARTTTTTNLVIKKQDSETKPASFPEMPKRESMSLAGIGNAALAIMIADVLKTMFANPENRPVTKGDLDKFIDHLGFRFHRVLNLPPQYDGALPYFDLETNNLVYSKD